MPICVNHHPPYTPLTSYPLTPYFPTPHISTPRQFRFKARIQSHPRNTILQASDLPFEPPPPHQAPLTTMHGLHYSSNQGTEVSSRPPTQDSCPKSVVMSSLNRPFLQWQIATSNLFFDIFFLQRFLSAGTRASKRVHSSSGRASRGKEQKKKKKKKKGSHGRMLALDQ